MAVSAVSWCSLSGPITTSYSKGPVLAETFVSLDMMKAFLCLFLLRYFLIRASLLLHLKPKEAINGIFEILKGVYDEETPIAARGDNY